MILDKNALLGELKLNTETVPLDGGEVIVSEIGAVDWMELVSSDKYKTGGKIDEGKLQPMAVARAVLNEDGTRMFTDEEAVSLAQSAKGKFNKIVAAVLRLNGIGGELEKN